VKKLKEEIMKLEKHMELNEEINNFINQIPEDIKYIDSINELEQIIGK
jgi:DNA-binding transcriptional regulator GbsR (MarR family)